VITNFLGALPMTERTSKSLLYTYGMADLFFTLMIAMELYYFPNFLTDYAQFPEKYYKLILLFTSMADILCSLIAGMVLQKTNLKFGGKYRSWFLIGPWIVAPLFVLQFLKIGSYSMAAAIIIMAFIISHLLWNVIFTASGAMVGRLSELPDERTVLSANRAQGIALSGLIFSPTAMRMVVFFGATTHKATGFAITVAIYACLMIIGYLYVYKITAGKDPYDEAPVDTRMNEPKQSMFDIIKLVFENPPLLLLVVAETFRSACIFIIAAFAVFYFKYVLNDAEFISNFLLAISIAQLAGAFAAAWIGARIGKRNSYWIFLGVAAVLCAVPMFTGGGTWVFTAIFSLALFFANVAGSMSTALFSDTVVYGEWKTGKNIRAFILGLSVLSVKLGLLIRNAIVAVALPAIGYVANANPSQGVVNGLRSIMTLGSAAACIIGVIVFYYGYRIEDSNVLQMQEEIAARKAGDPVGV
jgi:Na+/melibiose symporter-like transporter